MVERDARGRFRTAVTVADVLALYEEIEGPVLGASDVAERLGCTRATAREKLTALENRGLVASRRVGRTTVFWRVSRSGDLRDWSDAQGHDP